MPVPIIGNILWELYKFYAGHSGKRNFCSYQSFSKRITATRSRPILVTYSSSASLSLPPLWTTKCELNSGEEVIERVEYFPAILGFSDSAGAVPSLRSSTLGDESLWEEDTSAGEGGGGNDQGKNCGGGGGGRGDDGGHCNDENGDGQDRFAPDGELFDQLLNPDQVFREINSRELVLPADMWETAKAVGLNKLTLLRYLNLQESNWLLKWVVQLFPFIRDRLLADPRFLMKVAAEVVVEAVCVTVAEVKKRGEDFWREFELYAADLVVGIAVGIALVSISAPSVQFGRPVVKSGFTGWIDGAFQNLPSSIFESNRPGHSFTLTDRIGTYFYKGIQYGFAGFLCGIVGQAMANGIMSMKRKQRTSDESVPVPPLLQTAVLWGAFLAVSSNIRYQLVAGLEQAVEASPLSNKFPPLALAFTVGIRFANNVYGGMQFVDWARWSGVQ